jgi:hypothetical protein
MEVQYDPLIPPDPDEWTAVDEWERTDAVLQYHRREGVELPNERIHASIHVTVENQIALLDETPVADTIQRLMGEGLDRHDAVHAVGSVLAAHIWEIMRTEEPVTTADPNVAYFEEVSSLTAQKWLEEYGDDEE